VAEVLPTIVSRCQLVRFDAPSAAGVAADLVAGGVDGSLASACARLGLGDTGIARELASVDGVALRAAAEDFARAALAGSVAAAAPWSGLLAAVRGRGERVVGELEERKAEELELYPRKERKRVETEWNDRIRRAKRRVETGALDLGLQLVTLWFSDLAALSWGAEDLIRNVDRMETLSCDAGPSATQLRRAIELVEDTRVRFILNVSEELACEALAYRLERELSS
jgi:DNA polymerase-3 subunit delta'